MEFQISEKYNFVRNPNFGSLNELFDLEICFGILNMQQSLVSSYLGTQKWIST